MNELFTLTASTIGSEAVQTVNARDLHIFLEVGKDFSNWIKDRVEKYGFIDGQDYVQRVSAGSGENLGGRPRVEFHVSLDMAKELAMVERNDKGKQARQYFIECERRVKSQLTGPALPDFTDPAAAAVAWAEQFRAKQSLALENAAQAERLAIAVPKAAALDLISADQDALTITQAAKTLGIKRERLTNWLHANGWSYRQNGSWLAYQPHINNGRLQYKEARYTDQNTGQECIKPYFHILPKGLAKLAEVFAVTEAA